MLDWPQFKFIAVISSISYCFSQALYYTFLKTVLSPLLLCPQNSQHLLIHSHPLPSISPRKQKQPHENFYKVPIDLRLSVSLPPVAMDDVCEILAGPSLPSVP